MIDDGTSVSYHKTINATCKEKMLMDIFSGWELDLLKPLDEIQVCCVKTKLSSRIYIALKPRLHKSSLFIKDKLYSSFTLRLRGWSGSYSNS